MKKQVVIQAGGKGKRLRPHTYVLPKATYAARRFNIVGDQYKMAL